jgi:hypothetical protein
MIAITLIYMLVNVAYYAVVDKDTILNSGRIIAALFFGRLGGQWTERVNLSGLYTLLEALTLWLTAPKHHRSSVGTGQCPSSAILAW